MSVADVGVIAAIVISLLSLFFSLWSFRRRERAAVRPVLVFERTTDRNWVIQNVGAGPALDVLIGDQSWQNEEWFQIAQCHAIAADAIVTLPWLQQGRELGATYCDVTGRKYSSWCSSYRTEVTRGNRFPEWERTDFEYDLRKAAEAA